ncbi:TetR/AcrR family transcriptional regulator [Mammaliicoccus sciuri]|uniref:TetR/AcrR family transcriptional regulator n=1 Tax=Mammaliicoccus sciuri TaxID=1296 RepID=UPI00288476BE|nr:TetR/AcrR family transcriptional regulator [Mammaliicoccus sciuri]MDT0704372.1 TetR/AcrR family transcriptional regulator [Mammaliicoccus sciuri]
MGTKNDILETAFIMFANHGYYGTSLADLASRVGIKKPSLYNHFTNKDELYSLCIEKCMQRGIDNLNKVKIDENSSKADLYNFSKDYIFDNINYIAFYFQMQSSPSLHQPKITELNNKKKKIIEAKLYEFLNGDANIKIKLIHLRTFFNGWLARRYFSKDEELLNLAIKEFDEDFEFVYKKIIR